MFMFNPVSAILYVNIAFFALSLILDPRASSAAAALGFVAIGADLTAPGGKRFHSRCS